MICIHNYSPKNYSLWNKFNYSSKNSLFMFDRNYMDYHADRFLDNSLLFYSNDNLIAILPCSKKDNILVSHGGLTYGGFIVGNSMRQSLMLECMSNLLNYLKVHSIDRFIYKSVPFIFWGQPGEEDQYALFKSGAHLYKIEASTVINLQSPIEMSTLRKRMIRRARKEGVFVSEELSDKSFVEFIDLLNTVLNEHHGVNAVHTAEELILLHSRFPNNIHLVTARVNNEMIAGTLLYEYGNVVHTQYLAANDKSRKIGGLDLVVSSVIERYRNIKKWLDFGISTEDRGNVLNEGLISQKEGFGGRTVVYKTWEIIVDRS